MFEDVAGRTRTLVRWLAALVASLVVCVAANVYAIVDPSITLYSDLDMGPLDWTALTTTVLVVITGVLGLRWIHAASANARRLAADTSVSPAWSVGWFFVPVANLWKPFGTLRETWAISHGVGEGRSQVAVPPLLRWWWSAWLAATIFASGARVALAGDLPDPYYQTIPIAVSLLSIGASALWWCVVVRLSRAQAAAIVRYTFA